MVGVGIGLYFRSLKAVCIVIFICAFVSLTAIYQNKKDNPSDTPSSLIGSTYGASRDNLKQSEQGGSDIAISVIITLFAIFASIVESYAVEQIDDSNLTTQDYAVVLKNPPKSITDVDKYYQYFSKFGDVCCVTIVKNNGDICTNIALKKKYQAQLEEMNRSPTPLLDSSLSWWQKQLQQYGFYSTVEYFTKMIEKLDEQINSDTHKDYFPWRVFAIFNTEQEKNNCLALTTVTLQDIWLGDSRNQDAMLEGTVLQISEACEPSDLIYENSHIRAFGRYFSLFKSYFICSCVMVASFFIIRSLANSGNVGAAIFISLINSILPTFAKVVTTMVEYHYHHSDVQRSILMKLVIIRCVNSGLLIYLAASFNNTFSSHHIESIQNILLADAITTPLFRFFDLAGIFQRYILGALASSQSELNVLWTAAEWTLAERYTDVLKTIFVGMFFAVPLPSGLFITAFAIINIYFVDKYSLARLWRRSPSLDSSLSQLSRYFFAVAVWAHVSVSRIYFANWPYGVSFFLSLLISSFMKKK